jgi:hypothetical protein
MIKREDKTAGADDHSTVDAEKSLKSTLRQLPPSFVDAMFVLTEKIVKVLSSQMLNKTPTLSFFSLFSLLSLSCLCFFFESLSLIT